MIRDMKMPNSCYDCPIRKRNGMEILCPVCGETFSVADVNIFFYRLKNCPLIELPPHGRLIDADELVADIKGQAERMWTLDAVSERDYFIERNEKFRQAMFKSWCESMFAYLDTRPTIIEAEVSE